MIEGAGPLPEIETYLSSQPEPKASVTGYCIKFGALQDVHWKVLEAALRAGIEQKEL